MKYGCSVTQCLILCCMVSTAGAAVLLTNGDFEEVLTSGWTQTIQGENYYDTLDRGIDFDPDPDYEARVKSMMPHMPSSSRW